MISPVPSPPQKKRNQYSIVCIYVIVGSWDLIWPNLTFLNKINVLFFFQINTLVQLENVASYPFISDLLMEGKVKIHAFWFDVRSADVLYFSKNRSRFEVIHEDNAHSFSDELD